MKSLDDIRDRIAELCDVDELERSFSSKEIKRVHDLMVACHATPVGRPTVQTLLAFAEALVEHREESDKSPPLRGHIWLVRFVGLGGRSHAESTMGLDRDDVSVGDCIRLVVPFSSAWGLEGETLDWIVERVTRSPKKLLIVTRA